MLSALPAIADIGRALLNVRVVPIADIAPNCTFTPLQGGSAARPSHYRKLGSGVLQKVPEKISTRVIGT
jgi:hypothetical protein